MTCLKTLVLSQTKLAQLEFEHGSQIIFFIRPTSPTRDKPSEYFHFEKWILQVQKLETLKDPFEAEWSFGTNDIHIDIILDLIGDWVAVVCVPAQVKCIILNTDFQGRNTFSPPERLLEYTLSNNRLILYQTNLRLVKQPA